jgi:CAAX protease family protein
MDLFLKGRIIVWKPAPVTDLGKALQYYIITFGLCSGLAALSSGIGRRTPDIAMFTPLAAVLLMLFVFTRDGYSKECRHALGLHRAGIDGWGWALAVPLFVLGFAYGIVWMSGIAVFVVPGQMGGLPSFVFDFIASIVIVAIVAGVGEEIGWRGYLLPHLSGLGVGKAMIVSGALHGFFHVPMIVWTPYYHSIGNPLIIVPLFLLTLTAAGVCYGYLRLTTGSVWPAAIAHSAFNILWARFNAFTVTKSPGVLEYLAGESGLLTLIGLVIAAGLFAKRLAVSDKLVA